MKQTSLCLILCGILLALMMTACSSPLSTSQPPIPAPTPSGALDQEPTISQVKKGEITIDGDLAEWTAREWFAVSNFRFGGQPWTPSPDLDVKVSFVFDTEKFYLAVKALDDDIQKVDRSWQFGDGFSFTLVTDEDKEISSYVYQYVFDQENKLLILMNGELFPPFDTQDIELKFRQHSDRLDYEVAIPLKLLRPFNPFIYKKAALNLIYVHDDGSEPTIVELFPDKDFYSETIKKRAGLFFIFKTFDPESAQDVSFHAALKKNFLQDGDTIELRYAVNADERLKNMQIRATVLSESTEKKHVDNSLDLQPGLNGGALPLKIGNLPSGNYTLQVTFMDKNGNVISELADNIFVLNRREMEKYRKKVAVYRGQPDLETSLSNLEIRFEWLDEFYKKPNYEDISVLKDWWGDIVFLISRLEKGELAVFDANTIKRYAHRSKIDDTLQPYSVFLPETFNPDTQYPLIVFLHGSGVDDQGAMGELEYLQINESINGLGYPMIAPKGRGPSSGYLGVAGEDVFDCIEHFISLYPNIHRDRIFLMGHSMGGIGAWRLGILKLDYFRGLIILSSPMRPQVLSQIDKIRYQNIFIIHGAKDLQAPVDDSRQAVEKLTAMQANFEYIELPEAGHALEHAPWTELMVWIKKYSD